MKLIVLILAVIGTLYLMAMLWPSAWKNGLDLFSAHIPFALMVLGLVVFVVAGLKSK